MKRGGQIAGRFSIMAASLGGFVLLASCSTALLPPILRNSKQTAHRYTHGPISFTVKLSRDRLTTAQELTVTLSARSKPGWDVTLPVIGAKLGGFTVAELGRLHTHLTSHDFIEKEKRYTLEPFLPGTYTIPSLRVTAVSHKSTVTVTSTELPVTVVSLIPKGTRPPLELEGLKGPLASPGYLPEIFAGATTLLAVLAATLLMFIGRMRRRRTEVRAAIPPWVRARKDLDYLMRLDLPASGRYKEFSERISLLVRRYIEGMFDMHAAEQTTEEFLHSIRYSSALGGHRLFLSEFLSHCDLVKFAAYLPAGDEVDRAIRSCRDFIDSTSRESSDR